MQPISILINSRRALRLQSDMAADDRAIRNLVIGGHPYAGRASCRRRDRPRIQPTAGRPPLAVDVESAIKKALATLDGRLPANFVPLFGLTGGNLTNALSQLSGEAATGAQLLIASRTKSIFH
jgi:hypothetical protein